VLVAGASLAGVLVLVLAGGVGAAPTKVRVAHGPGRSHALDAARPYDHALGGGATPQAEICNGIDDDLDGVVDDNLTDSIAGPVANGAIVCGGASGWVVVCNAPYADADGQLANGCESNLQTDSQNCGSVGNDITQLPHVLAVLCTSGQPQILGCAEGYQDLDANPANGCEFGAPIVGVPDAPTNVSAAPGDGSATVSFDAPAANGSPITGYTVTSSPGGVTGTGDGSPVTVSGLTNGTSYTFTVVANSAAGPSAASDPSNAVVPGKPPVITSFAPASAAAGAPVTITGTGFTDLTEVDFAGSGAPVTPVSHTATKVEILVPGDATVGPITVQTSHGDAATGDFKPIPKITSLSAYDGAPNNLVAINGTNLADPSAVKFGTLDAGSLTGVSATEVDAHVPLLGFSSGKVSVTTPGGTAISTKSYAITKITSFSPLAATAGKTITITGQGLASTTDVEFVNHSGGVTPAATPTATSVKVVVPNDAAVGDLMVETANVIGPVTSPKPFTPVPSIASFDPPDGVFGTTVHIAGANFVGSATVKFGKLFAGAVSVVSPTEIDADVPTGFTGGTISVQNGGGTAVSKTSFVMTKVTGFTPLAATAGKTVTITGQGLKDVSAVDFVGHAGVVPSSTSTTSAKVLVPDDAITGPLIVHTPAVPGGFPMTTASFKAIPTITDVSPVDGMEGTTVTITGTNFVSTGTVVKFGTIQPLGTINPDSDHILANIPTGFSSGKITVVTDGGTATSKKSVSVTKVTGISPAKAVAGQTVTITGQGLGSTTSVNFTGPFFSLPPFPPMAFPIPATVVSVSATAVKVIVPALATNGPLTVNTPNVLITGVPTPSFTPLPSLTSIDPSAGQADGLVIVNGANLEPTGDAPTVTIGTHSITPAIASSATLLLTLPDDAITGQALTVTTPNGTASLKLKVKPSITDVPFPAQGVAGTEVVITGKTFTGTTKVAFAGGASVPFTLAGALGSDQTLTFKVPATAKSGPITVTNAGGSADSPTFTVDPVITSFTPTTGPVGATLTVKGTGFDTASRVTFGGGVTATPTNVTTTSLKVVVPQGVDVGPLDVHTDAAGNSLPSSATFTPTATISSISPGGGAAGSSVEIDGAGFTGVTDVKFGSMSVDSFNVVNNGTTIDTTVPVGATDGVITVVRSAAPTTLTSAASFSILSVTSLSATDVHEGDTLTINGTHLGNATGVSFTGAHGQVTPTNVTNSSLDVVVPAGASNGVLTVTTSDFGDVTTPSITILPPEIDSISFTGYSSSGSMLQIDGVGFTGLGTVTIGGTDVTEDEYSASASSIEVLLPYNFAFNGGGTSGTVVVHTDAGDSNASGTTVYKHTAVTVNYFDTTAPGSWTHAEAQAAAELWLVGTPTDITCSGNSAVQIENGGSYVTFVWGTESDTSLRGLFAVANSPTCPTAGDMPWN